MVLCTVCKDVRIESLPQRRKGHFYYDAWSRLEEHARHMGTTWNRSFAIDGPGYQLFGFDEKLNKRLGEKHRSFSGLKRHAQTCPLCALILRPTRQLRTNLNSDPVFNDLHGIKTSDFLIYLTRRFRRDVWGFEIWTNAGSKGNAFLIGAVGFCVDEGSTLAQYIPGRPIDADPNSPASRARVKDWIDNCNQNHKELPMQAPRLPTRVIDIGSDNSEIKLVQTSSGDTGRYTTLSWRWPERDKKSPRPRWETIRASLPLKKINMLWDSIPKVHQDAITVTRQAGLRYIWIDSHCIVQDDDAEKKREFPKMATIYSNSYLTISASWIKDINDGCFALRTPPKYAKFQYTIKAKRATDTVRAFLEPYELASWWDQNIPLQGEILSTRGWAFQERYLSIRTLYFAKAQMYFECCKFMRGENGFAVGGRLFGIHDKKRTNKYWNYLIESYSSRTLTYETDRLVAIEGLAVKFNEKLNDRYLAGIWHGDLLRDLLWSRNSSTPRKWKDPKRKFVAPSWSWAAVGCEFDTSPYTGVLAKYPTKTIAKLLDSNVTLESSDQQYGHVTKGYLKLRAPWIPVAPSRLDSNEGLLLKTRTGKRLRYGASLDYKMKWSEIRPLRMYATPIVNIEGKLSPQAEYPSILVTPVPGKKNRFSRIGNIFLDKKSLGDEAPDQGAIRRTFTLV